MSLTYLKVVHIVCRSDFYSTGTLLRVCVFIGDDRDLAAYKRQDHRFAYQMCISFISLCNSDRNVSEHSLRTGCSNRDAFSPVRSRISEIPVVTIDILVLYLSIRQRCLAAWTPVDDPESLIDKALFVKTDEHFVDSLVTAFIHSKALSSPVAGVAELTALTCDTPAVFSLPVPCIFEELLTGDIMLVNALFFTQLFYYLDFCSYAGVV